MLAASPCHDSSPVRLGAPSGEAVGREPVTKTQPATTPAYHGIHGPASALHNAGLGPDYGMLHAAGTRFGQPYLRVSTDDKDQHPLRQLDVIRPWAHREGIVLLPPVVDEGTSAYKTNPFERPRFVEACETARRVRAEAIVVEMADRFSRQGAKLSAWAEVQLELEYGLKLYCADARVADIGTLSGDMVASIRAEISRENMRVHSARVRSGMAHAKAQGKKVGGAPPKPLSQAEYDLAVRLKLSGKGYNTITVAINDARGALKLSSVEARRRVSVSANHVRHLCDAYMAANNILPPHPTRGYWTRKSVKLANRASHNNQNTQAIRGEATA